METLDTRGIGENVDKYSTSVVEATDKLAVGIVTSIDVHGDVDTAASDHEADVETTASDHEVDVDTVDMVVSDPEPDMDLDTVDPYKRVSRVDDDVSVELDPKWRSMTLVNELYLAQRTLEERNTKLRQMELTLVTMMSNDHHMSSPSSVQCSRTMRALAILRTGLSSTLCVVAYLVFMWSATEIAMHPPVSSSPQSNGAWDDSLGEQQQHYTMKMSGVDDVIVATSPDVTKVMAVNGTMLSTFRATTTAGSLIFTGMLSMFSRYLQLPTTEQFY